MTRPFQRKPQIEEIRNKSLLHHSSFHRRRRRRPQTCRSFRSQRACSISYFFFSCSFGAKRLSRLWPRLMVTAKTESSISRIFGSGLEPWRLFQLARRARRAGFWRGERSTGEPLRTTRGGGATVSPEFHSLPVSPLATPEYTDRNRVGTMVPYVLYLEPTILAPRQLPAASCHLPFTHCELSTQLSIANCNR